MRLSDFTTLSFDCYGTLIDWESGLLRALEPLRTRCPRVLADEEVLAAFGAAESAAQARAPAMLYPDILSEVFRTIAASWQVGIDDGEAARFGQSVGDWPPFPDSAAALAYLKRHYRLVILSNVDRASFARSNAKLGVEFDRTFTAQDIGSYKPDVRNLRYMLDRLAGDRIAANQVLHVAQSLFHDHVPAKKLGLATVWVNRRAGKQGGGATPRAQATPDLEIGSLAELAELHQRQSARA